MHKFKLSNAHRNLVILNLREAIADLKAGRFPLKGSSTQEIINNCVVYIETYQEVEEDLQGNAGAAICLLLLWKGCFFSKRERRM